MKNIINIVALFLSIGALTSLSAETAWTPPYQNSQNINKTLIVDGATDIVVKINGETERNYDFVSIFDANDNFVRKLDGKFNESFNVTGDSVRVNFTTDGSVVKSGFSVKVEQATAREYTGQEDSFSTGNYSNNAHLTERLSVNGATDTTMYEVNIVGESEGSYDFLSIKDASGTVIRKVSGVTNTTFDITSKYIDVEFTSDSSVTKSGLSVLIKELQPLLPLGNYPTCSSDRYSVGDTMTWNSKEYLVVDNESIKTAIDYSSICTTQVTDMSYLFAGTYEYDELGGHPIYNNFNNNISNFDTFNVTNMSYMFNLSKFNQQLGSFNTSNVTNMEGMFKLSDFNQSLDSFDTLNVTNMSRMFAGSKFNQSLSNFETSNVTDMRGMFGYETPERGNLRGSSFNQPLNHFDISNVIYMSAMFAYNTVFNQDISNWNVSQFNGVKPFDFDIMTPAWQEEFKPQFETIPAPRYIRANDMVTDTSTGLIWQDDEVVQKQWFTDANYATCFSDYSSLACFDTSGDTAASYCSALTLGEHTDWRLPAIGELESIVDDSQSNPAIDTTYFNNVNSSSYWSSTTYYRITYEDSAWIVDFSNGVVDGSTKVNNHYVRCVRDEQ